MADEIIRDIFVRNRGLPVRIDYVQGTNAVPLKFQFRDYTVPSGAAARKSITALPCPGTQ